ncbi:MAG: helix-turn-helix domain-containing protein [Chloroflexi bacterium]|nr:helix-turn-helix domain-containing protein [Chloroflexota bacterium]
MTIAQEIGKRLREAREGRGWSPEVAAAQLGIEVSDVLGWESAEGTLYADDVPRVAEAYGMSISWLLEGELSEQEWRERLSRMSREQRAFLWKVVDAAKVGDLSEEDMQMLMSRIQAREDLASVTNALESLRGRRSSEEGDEG